MRSQRWSRPVLPENWRVAGFGLYIHWPFCQAKCPYCDFNSHVTKSVDQDRWRSAYLSEIDRIGSLTPDRDLTSIYFGGGTPSLMSPDLVAEILAAAQKKWRWRNDIEITLEANPTSTEAGKLRAFSQAGVNRVSLGLQALNDDDLRALGRLHSMQEGLAALEAARSVFDRVNFDLIYARQNQSRSDWKDELNRALSFDPSHMSLYQLTIEPGTAFGDRFALGKLKGLPVEEDSADMFFDTQEACSKAGLPAYEVSNHAKNGYQSQHNLIYWRGGDVVGLGPGAHGRFTVGTERWATETALMPGKWLDLVDQNGSGETVTHVIDGADRSGEYLMMCLRLKEGVDLDRYSKMGGENFDERVVETLLTEDLIQIEGSTLRTTDKGAPLLNAILRELLVT